MINLILSLLACAAPQAALDSNPADTSADTAAVDSGPDYAPVGVPASTFVCDEHATGLADIPEGAWGVVAVHLVGCDGEILGKTDEWSLSATRIIVACGDACGGEVVWAPGE